MSSSLKFILLLVVAPAALLLHVPFTPWILLGALIFTVR
jgi:hypothetical protein